MGRGTDGRSSISECSGNGDFRKRYPDAQVASTEDDILSDQSIQLVCSAAVPNLRAPSGTRAMGHGKDYLGDKPAMTTLQEVAEVCRILAAQKNARIR